MSFWDSIKSAVGNAYCEVSDFATWYAANVADLLDETKLDNLAEAQRDLFVYWNSLACGKDTDNALPPAFSSPFVGGQCVGVTYSTTASFTYISRSDGATRTQTRTVTTIGKVSSVELINVVTGNGTAIRITHAGGVITTGTINTVANSARLVSVTNNRADGLPDNCGSPPPTGSVPSRQPFTQTRDITYTDDTGASATATAVQFTYGLPIIEPNGTISVPYEVCYNNFCFKGKTNFGDELVVKPEPPNQNALPPLQTVGESTGEGTETPDPELDGEPLPEAEKEKKPILGVFVKSQKTGSKQRATEIFLGNYAPAILAPNIGFVRYRIYVGEESGWLADIPIKNVNAYIPVPDKLEAVEVKVEWQEGWKGRFLINRGKHCCQECEDTD